MQCSLNILAELPRLSDCKLYKDWWNTETVEEVRSFVLLYFKFLLSAFHEENVTYLSLLHVVLDDVEYTWYVSFFKHNFDAQVRFF